MAQMRAEYRQTRDGRWGGWAGFKGSSREHSPRAEQLAGIRLVIAESFERLYRQQGGDFGRFYAEAARIGELPKAQRHATLRAVE